MENLSKTSKNKTEISLSNSLLASAKCIDAVLKGKSLPDSLAQVQNSLRPSVQAISFYTLRNLGYAQAARKVLVKKVPKKNLVDALLLVCISLLEASIKDETNSSAPIYTAYTIVDQAVRAASGNLKVFKGLINATLRNYIRQRDSIWNICQKDESAVFNYPIWWINKIKNDYPNDWQQILNAGNQHAPLILRVNLKLSTVDNVIKLLNKNGIETNYLGQQAIHVVKPIPVTSIAGFEQGLWSVQDLSAQQAGNILSINDSDYVLDACSAPGGKTAHILEKNTVQLLALDNDKKRLSLVYKNLNRLQLNSPEVKLKCANAADLDSWWDGKQFDSILLDAPCTASGIVRRHPDIRWLRRPEDINQTAEIQQELLQKLWQTLKPGGSLLYASCSIFPQEGIMQVEKFLSEHQDAVRQDNIGQILPSEYTESNISGDGFFYALFKKTG